MNEKKEEKLLTISELKKMYNTNEGGFKDFVKKFARSKNVTISEVFTYRMTNYKAQEIKEMEKMK